MALKEYMWRGRTWQFEESEAPEGAKLCRKAAQPANKAAQPANKAAKPAAKTRTPRTKKAE